MSEKTIESELITEEELVNIANDLGGDHGKFISDLYDFGDMWLLCDIVVEYVDRLCERSKETAGEVSPLIGMVSFKAKALAEEIAKYKIISSAGLSTFERLIMEYGKQIAEKQREICADEYFGYRCKIDADYDLDEGTYNIIKHATKPEL